MDDEAAPGSKDLAVPQPRWVVDPAAIRLLSNTLFLPDRLSEEEKVERMNLAMDLLADIRPEGALEGMLAVQMLATHDAAVDCLRRASVAEHSPAIRDMNYRHAAKMLSIYERQVAALDRHRGKVQPTVVVKYVHVAEGGQAIVGNVSHGGAPDAGRAAPPAPDPRDRQPMEVPGPKGRRPAARPAPEGGKAGAPGGPRAQRRH